MWEVESKRAIEAAPSHPNVSMPSTAPVSRSERVRAAVIRVTSGISADAGRRRKLEWLRNPRDDPPGDCSGFAVANVGQQDHKFVAAKAADKIGVAYA